MIRGAKGVYLCQSREATLVVVAESMDDARKLARETIEVRAGHSPTSVAVSPIKTGRKRVAVYLPVSPGAMIDN